MADMFSKKKRSEIMSRIRSKETGIERVVFAYLRKKKIHFQKHYSRVAGKPDIAIPSKRLAVFINGDFWHGYQFKKWQLRIPKEYWRNKIQANIERDVRNYRKLRREGWKTMRIWGHEVLENSEKVFREIARFLRRG